MNLSGEGEKILSILKKHEEMRRKALNLVASENVLSKKALIALASDLNGRYAAEIYGGTKYIQEIVSITVETIKELFKVDYASVKPVSGTISVVTVLHAFSKHGDRVAILHFNNGGFPLNLVGYGRKPVYLPFDNSKMNIDYELANELLTRERPKLVFLGASRILFPQPVKEISEIVHDYGGIVIYDGSHVLGLIAGKQFQDPLREGADCLVGSTHKTFPGPQGGVILTNNKDVFKEVEKILSRPYMLVDNPHVARIAALGITAHEMKLYGEKYASQVVNNAKRLGTELMKLGVSVKGSELGFTESHQLLLDTVEPGDVIKNRLSNYDIFIDAIGRIGVQEVTRRGMMTNEMKTVAQYIYRGIFNIDTETLKDDVNHFASQFSNVKFAFDE